MTNEGAEPDVDPADEERLELLISKIGLGAFPPDVQTEVETILATGQALEPTARARFVDAAKRGSRHVALSRAALEVLLFEERRERNYSAEDIAALVGLDADTIRAIERGERSIDAEEPPRIAEWAANLGLDREILDQALQKSLGTPVGAGSYSGRRPLVLTNEQKNFVQRVLHAFDGRNSRSRPE